MYGMRSVRGWMSSRRTLKNSVEGRGKDMETRASSLHVSHYSIVSIPNRLEPANEVMRFPF